ncbi:MAG: VTT domain-containing protein [Candidatus Andersenbacteria bacterium]
MADAQLIIELLTAYHIPAVFVGSFLFGETVLITIGYIMVQLNWSIPLVFAVALAGTILADTVWLLVGRGALNASWVERYKEKHAAVVARLEQLTGTKPFIALLFVKFLYGTRVLTILYMSWRKVPLYTFIFYDAIGTAIWLVVVLGIGALAAKGIANLAADFDALQAALVVIIIAILISRGITVWIKNKLLQK